MKPTVNSVNTVNDVPASQLTLKETLSLSLSLEVNLYIEEEGIRAWPLSRITPELREAIKKNRDELYDYLQNEEEHQLLLDIAQAGLTLRLKPNGSLLVSPPKLLSPEMSKRIKRYKDFLCVVLHSSRKIETEAEARIHIRSHFNTEYPAHSPVTKEEFHHVDERKAAFFKKER